MIAKNRKRITTFVSDEDYEIIDNMAKDENRTISKMCEILIKRGLKT